MQHWRWLPRVYRSGQVDEGGGMGSGQGVTHASGVCRQGNILRTQKRAHCCS